MMAMTCSLIRPLGGLALVLALSGGAAQAQTGFDGGSFDAGSFDAGGAVAPAPEPGPAQGGGTAGFDEGSFDAGGVPAEPQPPAPPRPPAAADPVVTPPVGGDVPAPPGGDDFDSGSFDDGNVPAPISGGGATPQPQPPQPQPPQPQPPQPQPPQPQPPVAPVITIPAEIGAFESRDFGVPPTDRLHRGQMHSPTPTAIPGAQVVGTEALVQAIQGGMRLVIIDALGGQYSLPGALMAPGLAEAGTYQDRVQQQATAWLGQITGNDATIPIVLYCSDPHCWLSYNASLRVVAAGYTNVYWYRGGLQAWQMAGLQLTPSGF